MNNIAAAPKMDIPDSRSLKNGKARIEVVHELWKGEEPPPLEFFVTGLIPKGFVSILYGHSGYGKSYIVLHLATCVCTGSDFHGLPTIKGPVLWVDAELDLEETKRRCYEVARGMGLKSPPKDLYYVKPTRSISDGNLLEELDDTIQQKGIVLTIIDSLSLGAIGMDMKDQKDAVQVLRQIGNLGTILALDHLTKDGAKNNQSDSSIFGSTFKRALARSTLRLTRADGGGLSLRQDKSNFSKESDALSIGMEFSTSPKKTVSFASISSNDPRMVGIENHLLGKDQTLYHLERLYAESNCPVPIKDLVTACDIALKTIRNHITALKNKVIRHGDSTYSPAQRDTIPVSPSLGTGNGNDGFIGGETVKTPKGDGVVEEKPSPGSARIPVRMTQDATVHYFNLDQISKLEVPAPFIPDNSTQKTLEL